MRLEIEKEWNPYQDTSVCELFRFQIDSQDCYGPISKVASHLGKNYLWKQFAAYNCITGKTSQADNVSKAQVQV